jgi:tripartite-type tricarboxylate transporter receptor subunit TctC
MHSQTELFDGGWTGAFILRFVPIAGRPNLPPNNFNELSRWMKQPGQNITVGHPGVGSFGHLVDVLVMQELGVKVTQVPYRGAGPALVDLLGGQVDLSPISAVVAGPLVNTGKMKAYAIIGRKRFAGLPDLPTMSDLGYKKLNVDFWHMLLAPAGTPRPIVDKLNTALRSALADARWICTRRMRKRPRPQVHCSSARSSVGAT